MKIVRSLLLLITIGVLMMWLLGGRTHTWTAELETAADPQRIFREITEPNRLTMWKSEVVQVDPLNELPPRVGTQARLVTEDSSGKRRIIESEIVEFDAERMLKLRLTSVNFEGTSTFIIERKGDRYHLQQRLQSRYRGLSRFLTPFIRSAVQERLDADFRLLKKRLDEPEVPVAPASNRAGV